MAPFASALTSALDLQLEEVYLTLSALINPDDKVATKEVEAELAQVRLDGGLEQEDDEDDE